MSNDKADAAYFPLPPGTHEVRPNWIVDADGKVRDGLTGEPVDNLVTLEGAVVTPRPPEPNPSQGNPDVPDQHDPDQGGIVPPYMTRRLEAMRRYPVEDEDYPGVDRNAGPRQAFIEGAEWEAERDGSDP